MAESFVYQGIKYNSKSDVIRHLYDNGFLTMEPKSKKQLSIDLNVSVQTIHATIVKHTQSSTSKKEIISKKPIDNYVRVNKKGLVAINQSPNPWGLPITIPYLMIDPKTEPRMKIEVEEFQIF
jgi:hypothetical protein